MNNKYKIICIGMLDVQFRNEADSRNRRGGMGGS